MGSGGRHALEWSGPAAAGARAGNAIDSGREELSRIDGYVVDHLPEDPSMLRLPRKGLSNWMLIVLMALISAGCIHHVLPVVEHPAYVTVPLDGTLIQGESLVTDWGKYRRALGNLRTRDGLQGPGCSPCTVQVRITAVEGAKYIDPRSPLSHTQLLAWIENLDPSHTAETFKLRPSSEAIYAVVAEPSKAGNKIRVIEIPLSPGRAPLKTKAIGDFATCQPYHEPLTSEADFRPCPYKHGETPKGEGVSSFAFLGFGGGVLPVLLGDPIWFSCNTGCCTGSGMLEQQ
jgi:hypothetical protein